MGTSGFNIAEPSSPPRTVRPRRSFIDALILSSLFRGENSLLESDGFPFNFSFKVRLYIEPMADAQRQADTRWVEVGGCTE